MSYRIHPLWRVERLMSPSMYSQSFPHPSVTFLSHHIPKTAGSSLRVAFEQSLGNRVVYGVYDDTGASEMSAGKAVWLPAKAKILHGHFKPHSNHEHMFPFAIKSVWVRDPLERLWSLVGHLMSLGIQHPQYHLLKSALPKTNFKSQTSVVHDLVTEDAVMVFTHAYSNFFRNVPISDFAFVGSKHHYEKGLSKLSALLNLDLEIKQVNRRNNMGHKLPTSIRRLESYLQEEYEIVGDYL